MMKRLLITGGAGFIGSNFVRYWLKKYPHHTLIVLDALTYAGNYANLEPLVEHPGFSFVKGNICDQKLVESLLVEHQIDSIVHFAAETHVDHSIADADRFVETNIIGTYSLLKAARKIWIEHPKERAEPTIEHRFHHVSTDEVYGSLSAADPAFTENTAYAPNSPYSATKAASDHLVRAFHQTYGLHVTTSHCSNNYGPYQFPEKLISLVVINILQDKPIPVYGDGRQIRDWLYVEDHVAGIDLVLQKGRIGEHYNIGGNNERANIDVVRTICQLIETEFTENTIYAKKFSNAKSVIQQQAQSLITHISDRPGHDQRYAINATKAAEELGYQPLESFESGIRKTIKWYLDNDGWWRSIIDN